MKVLSVRMIKFCRIFCFTALMIGNVGASTRGVPVSACNDMKPLHGAITAQKGTSPFTTLTSVIKSIGTLITNF